MPQLAAGWRVNGEPKVYVTKRAAYYAIAKQLVIEKYPPQLINEVVPPGWTDDLAESRSLRAIELFFVEREQDYDYPRLEFDEKKWTTFIRRVAKFLAFVDARRGETVEFPPPAKLHKEYEHAERQAMEWMNRAATLRAALALPTAVAEKVEAQR